jgi:hypothetical protein
MRKSNIVRGALEAVFSGVGARSCDVLDICAAAN